MMTLPNTHNRRPAPRRRARGTSRLRLLTRLGGIGALAAAIAYGAAQGPLDSSRLDTLSGALAGQFGHAAQEIRISGLEWQSPPAVLTAIGVAPGGPLVGFRPGQARRALEDLDWVESAQVRRLFPNQLEIGIVERQPFAIWQRDGQFHVIDKTGMTLTGIAASNVPGLPLVTGEGAERAVSQLVNHMEAHPRLRSQLKAAGRVGERRWNLYFADSIKVLLPENELGEALAVLSDLHDRHRIFDRAVAVIDLRVPGAAVLSPPPVQAPISVAGVSQR